MLDQQLRPLKDALLDPLAAHLPFSPTQVTLGAFAIGVCAPLLSMLHYPKMACICFISNRVLDGVDGLIARKRNQSSEFGGLLDIVCDFTVYSVLPIGIAFSQSYSGYGLAFLLASFHLNNTVLFYVAAVMEKLAPRKLRESTSLSMLPALIEGTESAVLFICMLLLPQWIAPFCWLMAICVFLGTLQRLSWAYHSLPGVDKLRNGSSKTR